jgi:glycosyltransferase involved in cell wall biosynthesis
MLEPSVSVVIPTYNRASYLFQALESVFAQTTSASEIIVIDDGSTDNTRAILAPLIQEGKIHYFFQHKSGVSIARNKGIEVANSPFIAFLDSDDLFLPSKLEKQIALFRKHPEFGFVHCSFSKFNNEGDELGVRNTSRYSGKIYPAMLLEWSVLMALPCMMARKEVLVEVGGFDQQMVWAEDLDLWRRIAYRYEVGYVPEVLVRVRVHSSSVSAENKGGASGFERYLEKAFIDDPDLDLSFKLRALGKMYTNLGQNILGDGTNDRMHTVRQMLWKGLRYWPFQLGAIASWIISLFPLRFRHSIAEHIRRRRYSRETTN